MQRFGLFFAQRALLLAVVDLSNPPKIPKMVVSSGNLGQNDQILFQEFCTCYCYFFIPSQQKEMIFFMVHVLARKGRILFEDFPTECMRLLKGRCMKGEADESIT